MRIESGSEGELILKEVYDRITLRTREENQIHICMRDDTFEIEVDPSGRQEDRAPARWRVDMEKGGMKPMKDRLPSEKQGTPKQQGKVVKPGEVME